ncbi:MAG: IS4 family transposase [Flavisolibacter sp.]|nr:IS4 family transposase [Flavisolibacter sp.]
MNFAHADRRARYEKVMGVLGQQDCSLSFPYLFKDQYQLKAFYRFINNPAVTHATFMSGYQEGLIQYEKEQDPKQPALKPPWLLIQDTMLSDYNSRSLELGYTQTEHSNGFLLHHGLLLDEKATPLGLLHQQVIHRERSAFGKAKNWRSKNTEDKQSNKWIEALKTGVPFSETTGRDLIHIMDREADIVDLINAGHQSKGQSFIIRARHDRSTLTKQQRYQQEALEQFRLFQLMPSLPQPALTQRKLRDSKGKLYEATCSMNYHRFSFRGIEQPVYCVWIKEKQPKAGRQAAEWFLLTNLQVNDFKDAEQVAEWYSKRWIIEEYHKCYKTGCSIEKRQFDSRKALTTAIGMLALRAVVLLRSRYYAAEQQNASFETVVQDPLEQALAQAIAPQYLKPVDTTMCQPYTALGWLLLLGRMGGHQGIKQKGLPGWQTLWRGYTHFHCLLIGFRLNYNTS